MHHVLEEEAMGFGRTGGADASIGTNEHMPRCVELFSTHIVHCASVRQCLLMLQTRVNLLDWSLKRERKERRNALHS
jgi:hypothetical protein